MKKQEQEAKEGSPEEDSPRVGSGKAPGGPSGSAAPAKGARKLTVPMPALPGGPHGAAGSENEPHGLPEVPGQPLHRRKRHREQAGAGSALGKAGGHAAGPAPPRDGEACAGSVRLTAGAAAEAGSSQIGRPWRPSGRSAPPAIHAAAAAASPPSPVRVSRPAASAPCRGSAWSPRPARQRPPWRKEPVQPPARVTEEPPAKPEVKPPLRVARPAPAVSLRKPAAPPPQPVRPPERRRRSSSGPPSLAGDGHRLPGGRPVPGGGLRQPPGEVRAHREGSAGEEVGGKQKKASLPGPAAGEGGFLLRPERSPPEGAPPGRAALRAVPGSRGAPLGVGPALPASGKREVVHPTTWRSERPFSGGSPYFSKRRGSGSRSGSTEPPAAYQPPAESLLPFAEVMECRCRGVARCKIARVALAKPRRGLPVLS